MVLQCNGLLNGLKICRSFAELWEDTNLLFASQRLGYLLSYSFLIIQMLNNLKKNFSDFPFLLHLCLINLKSFFVAQLKHHKASLAPWQFASPSDRPLVQRKHLS